MKRFSLMLATLAAVILMVPPSLAMAASADIEDHCKGLDPEQRAAADAVMAKIYPHDCCDDTLAACVKSTPVRLIRRLASEVCRQVARGRKAPEIQRSLERRAASMTIAGPPADIARAEIDFVGQKDAPVEIISFICARCPYCSLIIPGLHECVTDGRTAGKARLGIRIFPIRGHTLSTEGALALAASQPMGPVLGPYLLQPLRPASTPFSALEAWTKFRRKPFGPPKWARFPPEGPGKGSRAP